jgi:phosphatidylglycerophosphatase A
MRKGRELTPPAAMPLRDKIAHVLAVWFGCGHVPVAPGTAGTLGAVPLYLGLRALGGLRAVAVGAVLVTAVGVWAASSVAARIQKKDPQIVVIDEVAGFLVTMLGAPTGWRALVAGFVLFRVFDQLKPWPARYAERAWPSGWGIMFDDVFAGVWGALVLHALRALGVV